MSPESLQQHREIKQHVVVGSMTGTLGMVFLMLLLFLLPILFGGGGNSQGQGGGGGLGSAAAGGGRSDQGEVGQGTTEVSEVLEEGGSQANASSTEPEQHTAAAANPQSPPAAGQQSTRERPKEGLTEFSLAAIPETQEEENRARTSQASAGFNDIDDRLRDAGAKSGDVQISLAWNNVNDLDLHVETPSGDRIFFNKRRSSDGGELDVDMNAGGQNSTKPVENVFWATNTAPKGRYVVWVHHYANQGGRDPTRFQLVVKVDGRSRKFEGSVSAGESHKKMHEFTR